MKRLSAAEQELAAALIEAHERQQRPVYFWSRVVAVALGGILIGWLLFEASLPTWQTALILAIYVIQPIALLHWIYSLQVQRRAAVQLLAELRNR